MCLFLVWVPCWNFPLHYVVENVQQAAASSLNQTSKRIELISIQIQVQVHKSNRACLRLAIMLSCFVLSFDSLLYERYDISIPFQIVYDNDLGLR